MPTVVANNNNNNTSSTKTHTDYSLTEDMKKAVSLWDKIIVAHKRGKLTKVRWPDCDGVLLSEEEWIDKVMSKKTYSLCKLTFVDIKLNILPSVDMQQIINAREQDKIPNLAGHQSQGQH